MTCYDCEYCDHDTDRCILTGGLLEEEPCERFQIAEELQETM